MREGSRSEGGAQGERSSVRVEGGLTIRGRGSR